jgi:hypothetical protein
MKLVALITLLLLPSPAPLGRPTVTSDKPDATEVRTGSINRQQRPAHKRRPIDRWRCVRKFRYISPAMVVVSPNWTCGWVW